MEEQKELNLSLSFGAETGWSLLDGLVSCAPNGAADREGRINLWNKSDDKRPRGSSSFFTAVRDVFLRRW